MRRLNRFIAALLMFVYPLAAEYCLLEKANLVPESDCCPETTSHQQQEKAPYAYGCCPIGYAVYSSFDTSTTGLVKPPSLWLFTMSVALPEVPVELAVLSLEHSPPELPRSWQFLFRAALPPRAPSLVS